MALRGAGNCVPTVPRPRSRIGAQQRDVRSTMTARHRDNHEQSGLFLGRIEEVVETTLVQEEPRGTSPSFATFVGTSSGAWGGVAGAWNPVNGASEYTTVIAVSDAAPSPPAVVSSETNDDENKRLDAAVRYKSVKDSQIFTVDSAEGSLNDAITLKRIEYCRGIVKECNDLTTGSDANDLRVKDKAELHEREPGFVYFEDGCASRGPLVLPNGAAVIEGTLIDNGQRVRISLVLNFSEVDYDDLDSDEEEIDKDEDDRLVNGTEFLSPYSNEIENTRYVNGDAEEVDANSEPLSSDSIMNILQCTMNCEEWKGPSVSWPSPGFQNSTLTALSKCRRASASLLQGLWKVFEQKASIVDDNFVFSQREYSLRRTLDTKEREEGGYWLISLPYGATAAIETDIEANVLKIRIGWFSQHLSRKDDSQLAGDLANIRSEIIRTYDMDSGILLSVVLRNEIRGDWKGGRM